MKKLIPIITLLLLSNSSTIGFYSSVNYPLLNKEAGTKVSGSPEITEAGIINFTSMCNQSSKRKYDCSLSFAENNNGITNYHVEIVDNRDNLKLNPLYFYDMYISTPRNSRKISSVSLYSSARPANGLMDWDYRLLDTAVRTFVGVPLNRKALAKCYVVAQSDAKGCVVQTGKVNGVNYTVSVNFLYFTDDASGNRRNFSLKISAN